MIVNHKVLGSSPNDGAKNKGNEMTEDFNKEDIYGQILTKDLYKQYEALSSFLQDEHALVKIELPKPLEPIQIDGRKVYQLFVKWYCDGCLNYGGIQLMISGDDPYE